MSYDGWPKTEADKLRLREGVVRCQRATIAGLTAANAELADRLKSSEQAVREYAAIFRMAMGKSKGVAS
jgi:hypothetical protein